MLSIHIKNKYTVYIAPEDLRKSKLNMYLDINILTPY